MMAIWLPDLTERRGPKYQRIVDAIADDITAGRLPPGARLPPYRELAFRLGVSSQTVSRAYGEAIARALLRGEVGRGTFVRAAASPQRHGEAASLLRNTAGPIDLSRNLPLPGFAEPHIRRVLESIAREASLDPVLDRQMPGYSAEHAAAAAQWLAHCGIDAGTGETMTTVGAQHGLLCALMSLLGTGELLLTECLTYMPVLAVAERLGLRTATVALDDGGVIPEAFAELCFRGKPKAFYLTPTLQVPTTVTLDQTRRQAIAEIAQRHDVILVEDDVFGPLKPDRPPPIARLAPDHTIYVTSLSKAVAPGLRFGLLHAPPRLAPALARAVALSVWMTPPLSGEIAARLIRDGTAAELAVRQREAAQHRQALARAALAPFDFTADPYGLHLWLSLPKPWRADIFRSICASHGVLVAEARSFAPNARETPEAVRLSLSHEVDEARLGEGLRIVADLLSLPPTGVDLRL